MPRHGESLVRDEWEIVEIDHATAKRFVEQHHYSRSAANTSVYRHALVRRGQRGRRRIRGVALWMPPTKSAGISIAGCVEDAQKVLNLSRLACDPRCPRNSASFLLAGSMRLVDRSRWPILVTYADTAQGHTGAIYKATNWKLDRITPGVPGWELDGKIVTAKRGPRTFTRDEMIAMGAVQRPAVPKIRFVHDLR